MVMPSYPPSPARGAALARRLWRVVLAVWVVPTVLLLPALLATWLVVAGAVGELPPAGVLPPGEVALVAADALHHTWGLLLVLAAGGGVAAFAWVPLWHAGVVRWQVWAAGRPPRLGELLGLGLGAWWRYLRLAATGLSTLGLLLFVAWLPLGLAAAEARDGLAEGRAVHLQLAGVALSLFLLVVVAAAVNRAAWVLAAPRRRSALLAWFEGLVQTLRQPLASFAVTALWLAAGTLLAAVPVLAGVLLPGLRQGVAPLVTTAVCDLAAAACWVALLGSFSPPPPEPAEEPPATGRLATASGAPVAGPASEPPPPEPPVA